MLRGDGVFFETGGSVGEDVEQNWYDSRSGGTSGTGVPAAALFDVLGNSRRLFIIQYLGRVGTAVKEADVIDQLTAWETETPVADLSTAARELITVLLRHTHLPKLVDAGLVEYTADGARLTLGATAVAAEPHLALLTARENR